MSSPNSHNSRRKAPKDTLIYVVDDEPMLLELAQVILQPLSCHLETFRDPESALEAFRRADPLPAVIITDYAMHAMSGLDLLKACRRIEPRQKVLLVSGTVDEEIYSHSEWKPDRFLAKPYQPRQLVEMLKRVLRE